MPENRNRGRMAFAAILALSAGLSVFISRATAEEDHAYLPPWMRENTSELAANDQASQQQPVIAATVQIAKQSPDGSSSGLQASASAARTRVVRFVNKLFSRVGL